MPGRELEESLNKALGEEKGEHKVKTKQTEKVLAWMRQHGGISQRDAVQFGCYRLSARIKDLRDSGIKIVSENKGFSNADGHGHYAVYRLAESEV